MKGSNRPGTGRVLLWICCALAFVTLGGTASATSSLMRRLPRNAGCITCHDNIEGGAGCREGTAPCWNAFGRDFDDAGQMWTPALAARDSDGDGCSNAEELGVDEAIGMTLADFCARSPGIAGPQQCARLEELCCSEVTRPRHRCECGSDSPVNPVCESEAPPPPLPPPPAPAVPNDFPREPFALMDGVWMPFDMTLATGSSYAASCIHGVRDVWFEYYDCGQGSVTLEVEGAAGLAVYDISNPALPPIPRDDNELACQTSATRVTVDRNELLLQLTGGGSGRIRATCAVPESATWARGTTCGSAIPVEESILFSAGGDFARARLAPSDTCPTNLVSDKWFDVVASCTGTMEITAHERPCETLLTCNYGLEAVFSVYGTGDCGNLPPLLCDSAEVPMATGAFSARLPVYRGQHLAVRVGSKLPGLSISGELVVKCVEEPQPCSAFCHSQASCSQAGEFSCTCPPGYEGSGLYPALGGDGCRYVEACRELDLDCGSGYCIPLPDSAMCECASGYVSSGARCVDIDECSTAQGNAACNLSQPGAHTRCINREGSFACACAPGYSRDTSADDFRCIVRCGDGIRGPGESCDDGNTEAGDGCSPTCTVEVNHRCWEYDGQDGLSVCENTCGNGLIDPGETCDDSGGGGGGGLPPGCARLLLGARNTGSAALLLAAAPLLVFGMRRRRR